MESIRHLWDRFWNEEFWLPANVTWEDVKSAAGANYPDWNALFLSVGLCFILLVVGLFIEEYVWAPFGRKMGLKSLRPNRAPFNEILEDAYKTGYKFSYKEVRDLAKQLDMTERQVDRWIRLRKMQDIPNKLTRFCETSWPFTYYTCSFVFALAVLWDKQWFWDLKLCFHGMPFHPVDDGSWWLYTISTAYVLSMTIRHFFNHKHKDFWPMLAHHFLTISLLTFSWICNLVRGGAIVLFLHDIGDIFLLAAKMLHYLGLRRSCTVVFAIFTVIWIVTRLFVFPGWVICGLYKLGESPMVEIMPHGLPIVSRSAYNSLEPLQRAKPFPAQRVFLILLTGLQLLHFMWTYFLFAMLITSFRAGQMAGDTRSDSSEEISSGAAEASPVTPRPAPDAPSALKQTVAPTTGDTSDSSSAAAAGGDFNCAI